MRRGERPSHHRSWTQPLQRRGPRRPGLRVQRARECRQVTAGRPKQRGERGRRGERRSCGGQHLVAKPVASPDSARATEPRKPEAVLELRRGARLGSGAGERERERAWEEADVRAAVRNKAVAASWLGEGAAEGAAAAAGAVGEPAAVGAADRPEPAGPMNPGEAERDGVLKRSQHRELSCKLTQLITARHEAGRGHGAPEKGAENALPAKDRGDGRCSEQRDTKAKPMGHQSGEPPRAAAAGAQSRRGNQERRGRETGTPTRQGNTGQAHRRRQAGSQAQDESPRRGLDVHLQGSREVRQRLQPKRCCVCARWIC